MRGISRRWFVLAGVVAAVLIVLGVALTDDAPLDTYLGFNIRSAGVLVEDGEFVTEDNCMYLFVEHRGERFLPYFNALTTRWDADTQTVKRLNGASYGLGETVTWGASFHDDLPDRMMIVRGHASPCEALGAGFVILD